MMKWLLRNLAAIALSLGMMTFLQVIAHFTHADPVQVTLSCLMTLHFLHLLDKGRHVKS